MRRNRLLPAPGRSGDREALAGGEFEIERPRELAAQVDDTEPRGWPPQSSWPALVPAIRWRRAMQDDRP